MTYSFYQTNLELIYFIYGLAFFTMAIAVGVNQRRHSTFALARNLGALATFGLMYGVAEWLEILVPGYLAGPLVKYLIVTKVLLTGLSFAFLFHFGVGLIVSGQGKDRNYLSLIPWALFGLWGGSLFTPYILLSSNGIYNWYDVAITWARYLLVLPGGLLTAYAMYLQSRALKPLGIKSLSRDLKATAVVFVCFAIFAGAVVDQAPFFPAMMLNKQTFAAVTGIPVEILRAVCAVAMAIYSIRILRVFEIEQLELMRDMEHTKASFAERERIRQELHDGIIQSIYAVGLRLACASRLLEQESPAIQHIEPSITSLNEVIQELRTYLGTLKPQVFTWSDLRRWLTQTAREMEETQGIKTNIACAEGGDFLSEYQMELVYRICKEALHNVSKHAQATRVEVKLCFKQGIFNLEIRDNGIGLPTPKLTNPDNTDYGNGFKYMHDRVKSLGGQIQIESMCGRGTAIKVLVPREITM